MVRVDLDEKQMRFVEAMLDNMLRSQGLQALQAVVDFTNVLRNAKTPQGAAPTNPPVADDTWDS